MFDDFMVRATLASIGVAIAAAPLGCFVVWRRMAYFGDATAHAAILGVALSLILSTSIFAGVLLVALAMALTVTALSNKGFAMDTLLGVMAHSLLAISLVAVSFLSGVRIDLMSYLFGDILAVSKTDLMVIWGGVIAVLIIVSQRWSGLLLSTLNPELAIASGYNPKREQLFLTVMLAIVVAAAIKVVGALLIVAMLIIPAAAARPLARTPEVMAVIAAVMGIVASITGIKASFHIDSPTGTTIVCVSFFLFLVTNLVYKQLKTRLERFFVTN